MFTDLLIRYFRLVPVPRSWIEIQQRPEPILIVTQSSSILVQGLLRSIVERSGDASLMHGSAWLSTAPEQRTVGWASLEEGELLAQLTERHPQLLFTTFSFFHVRGPIRDLPSRSLSYFDLLRLLFGTPFLFIVFGAPFQICNSRARSARSVTRQLRVDFYRNLKMVRGTPFQSLQVQERTVLAGPEVDQDLRTIADRQGVSVAAIRRAASKEFRLIAAHPRRWVYGTMAIAVRLLLRRLFGKTIVRGLDELSIAVRQHTVVLVPMHRSHLDYVLVGSVLYHSNLNPPLVAAGLNLFFFPVGSLIKSLGAYFVRRDSRNNRVHAFVLRRYVTYLVKRGHLQEFFIEGGRSRSGKMRPPRLGLLGVIVEAYRRRLRKDILFVPVSITYERVVEDRVYGAENTGQKKERESFLSLLKARSIFRHRYGDVFIHFGKPLSLAAYIQASPEKKEPRQLVSPLGYDLTRAIRNQIPLTLTAVTYSLLLTGPRYGLTRAMLTEGVHAMARLARILHGDTLDFSPSLQNFLQGNTGMLNHFIEHGVIVQKRCLHADVLVIPGKQRFTADFYRNSCLHFFIEASLLALSELMDGAVSTQGALRFYDIFKHDMLLGDGENFERALKRTLTALSSAGCIGAHGRFTSHALGMFTPALLLNWIESYLWVLLHLKAQGASSSASPIRQSILLERLSEEFRTAVYLGLMTRTEAAAHSTLQSVLDSLQLDRCLQIEGSGATTRVQILSLPVDRIELLEQAHQRLREFVELAVVRPLPAAGEAQNGMSEEPPREGLEARELLESGERSAS